MPFIAFICYLIAVIAFGVGAYTRDLRPVSGGLFFAFIPPLIEATKHL